MHIQKNFNKDVQEMEAVDPKDCITFCGENGPSCNIVEYYKNSNRCYYYDVISDDTTFSEKITKSNVSKEDCLNAFNSELDSVFYKYKDSDCIIGIIKMPEFVVNTNLKNINDVKTPANVKFQYGDETNKAGKEGAKENNFVPLLLVASGIFGVLLISGLIFYGIKMVKKANEKNAGDTKNARNQVTYKIKTSDHYNNRYVFGSSGDGSRGSTLNNSGNRSQQSQHSQRSQHSQNLSNNRSQHSVSNIVTYDYSYNDSTATYINSSIQNTTLQDFYNNAALGSQKSYNNLQDAYNGAPYGTIPKNTNNTQDYYNNFSYSSSQKSNNNLDYYNAGSLNLSQRSNNNMDYSVLSSSHRSNKFQDFLNRY